MTHKKPEKLEIHKNDSGSNFAKFALLMAREINTKITICSIKLLN